MTTDFIRAIIVDDEAPARRKINLFLKQHQDIKVLQECSTGTQALAAFQKHKPELVFLDVQMPGPSGLKILSKSEFMPPAIIFITAFDQYALQAFDFNATDYMLKPFDKERFDESIRRARVRLNGKFNNEAEAKLRNLLANLVNSGSQDFTENKFLTRLAIHDSGEVLFLPIKEVIWFQSEQNYVRVHSAAKLYLIRESLKSLEGKLDPAKFIRIHRNAIVALNQVKSLQPYFNGDAFVTLENGTRLKVSRQRRSALEKALGAK